MQFLIRQLMKFGCGDTGVSRAAGAEPHSILTSFTLFFYSVLFLWIIYVCMVSILK